MILEKRVPYHSTVNHIKLKFVFLYLFCICILYLYISLKKSRLYKEHDAELSRGNQPFLFSFGRVKGRKRREGRGQYCRRRELYGVYERRTGYGAFTRKGRIRYRRKKE